MPFTYIKKINLIQLNDRQPVYPTTAGLDLHILAGAFSCADNNGSLGVDFNVLAIVAIRCRVALGL